MPSRMPGGWSFIFRISIIYALVLVLTYLFFGRSLFELYAELISMMTSEGGFNQGQYMAASAEANLASAIITLVTYALLPVVETAFHKNAFFGDDKGRFPLRFGMDEFTTFCAMIIVFICIIAGYFVAAFGIIIVVAIVAVIFGIASGGSETALNIFLPFATIISVIGILLALCYFAARLAPSVALTVRKSDMAFPQSWKPTKPIWKKVMLSYLTVYAVIMLFGLVAFGIAWTIVSPAISGASSADEILAALNTPGTKTIGIIVYTLYMIAAAVGLAHAWGVGAYTAAFIERDVQA